MRVTQMKHPRIRPYAFKVKLSKDWSVQMQDTDFLVIVEWLILNIGLVGTDKWEVRVPNLNDFNIYFSEEKDAFAFKLRWS